MKVVQYKRLKAAAYFNPFKQSFQQGRVHTINPEDPERCLCGKCVSELAGNTIENPFVSSTCGACVASERSREKQARHEAELAEREAERQKQEEERRKEYADYLRSPEWQRIREKVIRRAGGRCQGCESRPATCAHHLTYRHIFYEFCFQMVALCDACHYRLHQQKIEAGNLKAAA